MGSIGGVIIIIYVRIEASVLGNALGNYSIALSIIGITTAYLLFKLVKAALSKK